jgi:hypothetical protein
MSNKSTHMRARSHNAEMMVSHQSSDAPLLPVAFIYGKKQEILLKAIKNTFFKL